MVDPGHPQVIEGLTINPSNKHRAGFPGGSDSKESVCNAGDPSLIPGSGRSPGELANKHPYSQSFGFSSSHIQCESWTIKKAEHQTIDAFELQCWRRLLRAPWTTRRSCKTQNSGLLSKEEKPRDPINQPSRCNTQEDLLSVAQTGDSDFLGGRAHRTANWASFL